MPEVTYAALIRDDKTEGILYCLLGRHWIELGFGRTIMTKALAKAVLPGLGVVLVLSHQRTLHDTNLNHPSLG